MSDGCERCRGPKFGHHLCQDCREPEGTGWVTAPLLTTSEISQIILCCYTGLRPLLRLTGCATFVGEEDEIHETVTLRCPARNEGLHPDTDCLTVFFSARSLEYGVEADVLAEEVRIGAGGEILHVRPVDYDA